MTRRGMLPAGMVFTVGFFLVPGFPLMPYAAAVEALRAANRLSGHNLYAWTHLAPDEHPVQASNGLTIVPDRTQDALASIDLLIVCAGTGVEAFRHAGTMALIRGLARRRKLLGGVSGGPYLLARAGVLQGYRCTLHWDHLPGFVEEFPRLEVTRRLFEIDRDRLTCSGGIAALDLMHALIKAQHGQRLASSVADWFLHTHVRQGEGPQRLDPRQRFGVSHAGLLRVLTRMERSAEELLSRQDLAAIAGVSPRHLDRLFRTHLGHTLGEHYDELRLQRARNLLQKTTLAVQEVAVACGFASASHFSRNYRARFGIAPRSERGGAARRPTPIAGVAR